MSDLVFWQQPFVWLAKYMRPHNEEIALAMVATLLVIFGDAINKALKRLVGRQPFWIRISAFISLCAFGYGALSVWMTPVMARILMNQNSVIYVLTIVGSFLFLGILAERSQKA